MEGIRAASRKDVEEARRRGLVRKDIFRWEGCLIGCVMNENDE